MAVLQDCAKSLRDVLAPLGFKRKSSTWRRDVGDFVDIIEFQRLFGTNCSINIGVLTKRVHETLWGEAVPAGVHAAHGVVYGRLNHFHELPPSWQIDDTAAWARIAVHIQKLVVPFLDSMHSHDAQIQYLRDPRSEKQWQTPFYEAILLHASGHQAEACLMLQNYRPKRLGKKYGSEGFLRRAAEVAARLNCPTLSSIE
jgi:hypothetical protein